MIIHHLGRGGNEEMGLIVKVINSKERGVLLNQLDGILVKNRHAEHNTIKPLPHKNNNNKTDMQVQKRRRPG